MQTLQEMPFENQAVSIPDEIRATRKVGIEVVRSADLASKFFHGPRRHGRVFTWNTDNDWERRVERASQ